jgi:hypothetical protein
VDDWVSTAGRPRLRALASVADPGSHVATGRARDRSGDVSLRASRRGNGPLARYPVSQSSCGVVGSLGRLGAIPHVSCLAALAPLTSRTADSAAPRLPTLKQAGLLRICGRW